MSRWMLKEGTDGSVEVFFGRISRGVHPDLDAARAWVGRESAQGDRITHEAPDGYRSVITRSIRPRRGWRR